MTQSNWTNYPKKDIHKYHWYQYKALIDSKQPFIPHGNGASYGDCGLGCNTLSLLTHDLFIHFDQEKGIIDVQSGVLLNEILKVLNDTPWLLAALPGTAFITVGGAIAADVHGKDHHFRGCFSQYVREIKLLLPSGECLACSRETNSELFYATCGGQGLTGIIMSAQIQLIPCPSKHMTVRSVITESLAETLSEVAVSKKQYTVAWLDFASTGKHFGRGIVTHASLIPGERTQQSSLSRINVPFFVPSICINQYSIRLLNECYYRFHQYQKNEYQTSFHTHCFPLDKMRNWPRLYGRKGFIQYQCLLPISNALDGFELINSELLKWSITPTLSVMKQCGPANQNWLSFPQTGISLALDFKHQPNLMPCLAALDHIVANYQGNLYLAKDCRMSQSMVAACYPKVNAFRKLRIELGLTNILRSSLSERLAL